MANIHIKKPIDKLIADAADDEKGLRKTLTATGLIALGIGAIIGAGLFARTAAAIGQNAGPSVIFGFIIAALGCAFAGLCYAEFASMIPVAGSAYTYSYATMGEFMAWIIGWDLILEYGVGAAVVATSWSGYFNRLLEYVGMSVPYEWCHSPLETLKDASGQVIAQGIMNIPALCIIIVMSLLLIKGTRESAMVNGIIVIIKVAIVILFIVLGWGYINPANHTPYIPAPGNYVDQHGISHHFGGIMGILGAAGVVFFAFIGFDAASTAAQETKNPKRDMPIGILGSLVICTVLYVLFGHVLSGVGSLEDFRTSGKEGSVVFVINKYMHHHLWLGKLISVAILGGFSTVILVMLMGQSRVFYSMSHDGLVSPMFSTLNPKFRTPYKSNLFFMVLVGLISAFVPEDIVGDMSTIGTLFAFILVCIGIIILRKKNPDIPRQFKTPLVPFVPIAGVIVCAAMIFSLGWPNWLRLIVWMAIGAVIYFTYSIKHSKLNNPGKS